MRFPSREQVKQIRNEFPKGTRVELVSMDDRQAPPPGTKGTVIGVDDTGSLLMRWDNGSGLNVSRKKRSRRSATARNRSGKAGERRWIFSSRR